MASPAADVWTDQTLPGFGLARAGIYTGWLPVAEIDPVTMKARVCTYRVTDMGSLQCQRIAEPVCATSGTLTLKRLSATAATFDPVSWTLDVELGDLHLTGSF